MKPEEIRERIGSNGLKFSTSRSSGPGGQNVNKVNTKVELRFNIASSTLLTDAEKEIIHEALRNRISNEGDLLIVSQSERTQLQNKKKAEDSFYRLVAKTLTPKKERRATRPTKASREKRIEEKKKHSQVKTLRKINSAKEE
jgi:ribosome-associated protein